MNRALYDCVFVSFRRGWSCYYVCVFCFGRYTVPFNGPSVPWRDEKRACFTRWLMPSVVDISHFLKKQHKKKMMWFVVLTVSFSYYRYYRSRERTARENTVFSGTSCRRPSPGRRDVRRERWRTTNTDRWCSWGCGVDGAFFCLGTTVFARLTAPPERWCFYAGGWGSFSDDNDGTDRAWDDDDDGYEGRADGQTMVRGRYRGVPFFFWSDGTSSVSSAPRCRAALLRIPGRFRPTKRASRDAVSFFSNGKSESYTFLVVTASFLVVMAVVVNIYLQI